MANVEQRIQSSNNVGESYFFPENAYVMLCMNPPITPTSTYATREASPEEGSSFCEVLCEYSS